MIKDIYKVFNKREAEILGEYKKSAVMILNRERAGEIYLIFEKRAAQLRHQPGDISLPGGKLEKDESPRDAAIRETMEELNITSANLRYIGEMDYLISPYNTIIYPYIGEIKDKIDNPNYDEVEKIIEVPLKFFMEHEPDLYVAEIKPHMPINFPYELLVGGKNYKFHKGQLNEYFYDYNGVIIWGFTAQIIKSYVEILKDSHIR